MELGVGSSNLELALSSGRSHAGQMLPPEAERNRDLEIRIQVPERFGTLARKFKMSPERLAYLLCADFAYRPPSCLTIVVRYVRASVCVPRRKERGDDDGALR